MPTQLKPIGVLFEKLMKKPRPPPAKVTVTNETEVNTTTNATTSAEEEGTTKVDLPTDEESKEKESKAEGTDKEDLWLAEHSSLYEHRD